ncbi:MAG TPA: class D sortase [Candidatus Limnocylindrales bacterium]|jgi:sortase A|nr:class D sortase [Candidatus Limnocylindrales bacterium]
MDAHNTKLRWHRHLDRLSRNTANAVRGLAASPRSAIALALILVGLVLLGYVSSEYWGMFHRQKQLAQQWEQQAAQANVPRHAQLSPEDMLTRVIIPKIHLDAIVVEGASRKDLSEGPGHMRETAMPGQPGNAVITGHRDTFFRHIYELNRGDEITVRRAGQTYKYEVTSKKIVMPDDLSVIRQTNDPQLTLITCYPTYYIGPAPKRLVVFSRLVESSEPAVSQTAARGNGE